MIYLTLGIVSKLMVLYQASGHSIFAAYRTMEMRLSELRAGEQALLYEFRNSPVHLLLLTMGVSPGDAVHVIRRLPMGGNFYIRIGSRSFVLRKGEANEVMVQDKRKRA